MSILSEDVVRSSLVVFLEMGGQCLMYQMPQRKPCAFEEVQPLMVVKCLDVNAVGDSVKGECAA